MTTKAKKPKAISSIFKKRRGQLFKQMLPHSIAILLAAPKQIRNRDVYYSYRQDSNFYYLTGFTEPEAIAVLIKQGKKEQYILFNQSQDPLSERWNGSVVGQEKVLKDFGVDQSYPTEKFCDHLPKLLEGKKHLYYAHKQYSNFNYPVNNWIHTIHTKICKHLHTFNKVFDITELIYEMRLIKTKEEIQLIRKAANITSKAFTRIIKKCHAGMYEYQAAAELIHTFHHHNACEAFPTIVASGKNACTLHDEKKDRRFHHNDLVLVDAGCEYQYYGVDVSRTFPISGHFSNEQRAIYKLVLKAQQAVIKQIKPNNSFDEGQKMAIQIITAGLCHLNILSGNVDQLIKKEAYKPFYMHSVSHWIGLDTHDVGNYKTSNQWRKLQPGMVLSVEPGIYIPAGIPGVNKRWWNIGVRIEDDVLVTKTGCQILTKAIPKTIRAIENLRTTFEIK